jgi:hypothetical protein
MVGIKGFLFAVQSCCLGSQGRCFEYCLGVIIGAPVVKRSTPTYHLMVPIGLEEDPESQIPHEKIDHGK